MKPINQEYLEIVSEIQKIHNDIIKKQKKINAKIEQIIKEEEK